MATSYDKLVPALKKRLPEATLAAAGREVGFIRRLRTISAPAFVWAIILSRFAAGIPGFDEARRVFKALGNRGVWPRPFQMRFKCESAVRLMQSAFDSAVSPWRRRRQVDHPLASHFSDVVAIDSTFVQLHDSLSSEFKGIRAAAAQMKVVLAVSIFGLLPLAAKLVKGATSDARLLLDPSLFRSGSLLLFDNAFAAYNQLKRLVDADLHYLTPMRLHGHAKIVGVHQAPCRVKRALARNPQGVRLRSLLDKKGNVRSTWDLEVLVTPTVGVDREPLRTRLVIVPDKKRKAPRYYLTSLAPSWPPAALVELYRLRWQIELVFKELKQNLALEAVPSRDPQAVQVFIWASLLALAVSRTVAACLRPLASLCGLASRLRPAVLTRNLRGHIRALTHLLSGAAPSSHLTYLLTQLAQSSTRRGPPRTDSLAKLRQLLPSHA